MQDVVRKSRGASLLWVKFARQVSAQAIRLPGTAYEYQEGLRYLIAVLENDYNASQAYAGQDDGAE